MSLKLKPPFIFYINYMSKYVSEVVCIHYKTDNYCNINTHIDIKIGRISEKKETISADI